MPGLRLIGSHVPLEGGVFEWLGFSQRSHSGTYSCRAFGSSSKERSPYPSRFLRTVRGRGATECARRQTETGFPVHERSGLRCCASVRCTRGPGTGAACQWLTRLKGGGGETPVSCLCVVGQLSADGAQTSISDYPSHRHSKLRRARLRSSRRLVLTRVRPRRRIPKRHGSNFLVPPRPSHENAI